jgi:hypothetical protein
MKAKEKGIKTEDSKYAKLEKRLAQLDLERCIRLAQEEIRDAKEMGTADNILCPCRIHSKFGIKKRDLYALADRGELRVIHHDMTNVQYFSATELCALFERYSKVKANNEKTETAANEAQVAAPQVRKKAA